MDPTEVASVSLACHASILLLDERPIRFGGMFGMLEDRLITGLGVIHPTPRELLPTAIKFKRSIAQCA